MKRPPCPPDCPNRSIDPNCHMVCKKYKDWRLDKDRENAIKCIENSKTEYTVMAQIRMRRVRKHG